MSHEEVTPAHTPDVGFHFVHDLCHFIVGWLSLTLCHFEKNVNPIPNQEEKF